MFTHKDLAAGAATTVPTKDKRVTKVTWNCMIVKVV